MAKEAQNARGAAVNELYNFKPSVRSKNKASSAHTSINSGSTSAKEEADIKPALRTIKEATGLTNFNEIL